MKRCLLVFTMLAWSCYSFCQSDDSLTHLQNSYLQKSRHEKTAGTILLVGGCVLASAGVISGIGHTFDHWSGTSPARPSAGVASLIIGSLSLAASIPLFIVAETHKNKARHLSLAMQKSDALLRTGGINPVYQPALTLSFDLSKRKRRD